MTYCTNHCDRKQLLQRHPLRNPPLLRTPPYRPLLIFKLSVEGLGPLIVRVRGVLSQGESNMHQIVVTVSCRLCPPFPEGEFAVFRYRKTPSFYGKSYYFCRIFCVNPHFSAPGNWGQNVTRNGGPQFGACLIP